MKIDRIEATPVNVSLEAPYYWVHGELPGFTKTIIQVFTDDGLVGLGEAPGAHSATLIRDVFAPALIGRDPVDIQELERYCLPHWSGVQSIHDFDRIRAFGGLELALWDIRGKAWNRPLYDLLGGAVRKRIPFTDYFAFRPPLADTGGETTPEQVVDYCLDLHQRYGTTMFEGKFSTSDPAPMLRTIRLLRATLGETAMIRIDSNQAYSLTTARLIAPAIEEVGVRNWEDPVNTVEEMQVLRRHTRIPFSTHNVDLRRAVALGVPDAIVSDPTNLGGLRHGAGRAGARHNIVGRASGLLPSAIHHQRADE